jgi:hypothetical protein
MNTHIGDIHIAPSGGQDHYCFVIGLARGYIQGCHALLRVRRRGWFKIETTEYGYNIWQFRVWALVFGFKDVGLGIKLIANSCLQTLFAIVYPQ